MGRTYSVDGCGVRRQHTWQPPLSVPSTGQQPAPVDSTVTYRKQQDKRALNRWIIRRLKAWLLKQWRKPKTRVRNLKRLGLDHEEAMKLGNSRKRIWRVIGHYQLNFAMPQNLFTQRYGLIVLR